MVTVNSISQKVILRGPCPCKDNRAELSKFKAEKDQLIATNALLSKELQAINKELIKTHEDAKKRVLLLLRTLNPSPPPS